MRTEAEKVCEIIEWLVSDGLATDIEFRQAVHNNYSISESEAQILNDILGTIYRLTHVANKPSCLAVHGDWYKELNDKYEKLIAAGVIRPEGLRKAGSCPRCAEKK